MSLKDDGIGEIGRRAVGSPCDGLTRDKEQARGAKRTWAGAARGWLGGRDQLDPAVLLGHVIAHELGHLLLDPGHVPTGIMPTSWGARDMEAIGQRMPHAVCRTPYEATAPRLKSRNHAADSTNQGEVSRCPDLS
jgi:hypothetical protein